MEANPETPSYMIGIAENKIIRVPLMEAVARTRSIAKAISEKNIELALKTRGDEFIESLEHFVATSTVVKESLLPPEKVCSASPSKQVTLSEMH